MGSVGGSYSKSSSQSQQDMAAMGLGPLLGLGAFGGEFGVNQGGLSLTGWPGTYGVGDSPFGGGFIGPEQFGSMATLLDPMQLGPGEQLAQTGLPSNMALGALGRGNAGLDALLGNLYASGQPTDIDPIIQASRSFLGGERSRLREEMGAKRNFQSDIYGSYARAEANTAAQLGTLEFQAQEAAKDRAGQNLTSGIAGVSGQIQNILQTFGGLFGLEDAARSAARGETPGGRTADILSWLSGLQGPVGNVGRSESDAMSIAGNASFMGCWAAAQYYGWFTEEWWNARYWIMEGWNTLQGQLFRAFYLRHGEALAELIRTTAWLRDQLRPLFEWCERCGRELRYA